jgi:hypothetical protein
VVVIDLLPSFPDILLRSVYSLDPSEKASCRNCNNDMNGNRCKVCLPSKTLHLGSANTYLPPYSCVCMSLL